MVVRTVILSLVCAGCAVVACGAGQPAGGGAGSGGLRGLSIRDLKRVEQFRGDSGGLSRSLAQGPAELGSPNDFSGVYQIPEDADTPYAGWYARASGATIAVFPRGEYQAGENGMVVMMPANTRFFIGTIPLGGGKAKGASHPGGAGAAGATPANARIDGRVDDRWRIDSQPQVRPPVPDAPRPVTVETAQDLPGVSAAVEKLCSDPVYRANRVRELMERAARAR